MPMSEVFETKQSRKDIILEAAVDELTEQGIEGVRIEHILAKSGSSFSSLYHHFGSRENLITAALVAIFQNPVNDDISMFIEQSANSKNLDEVIAILTKRLKAILMPAGADYRQTQFRIIAASLDRPELREALQEGQRQLAQRLEAHFGSLQAIGALPVDARPTEIAWFFLQMAMGLVVTDINPEEITNQERVDLVMKAFLGILGNQTKT